MRIDKYLKVARVLKRRVVAKELAEEGRLLLNGKPAKAASEVKVADEIDIVFGHRHLKIRITDIKEHVKKEESVTLYEVISEDKTTDSL